MKEKRITGPVSPIDGRYKAKTQELGQIFSEQALMRYRIMVEIFWLLFLAKEKIIRKISNEEIAFLLEIYEIGDEEFKEIQAIEKVTSHDVNAMVQFVKTKMVGASVEDLQGFVHMGLTSEDVNNVAYAFTFQEGVGILFDYYKKISSNISSIAEKNKNVPMLALTHGQPASPVTFGKEMKVFSSRLLKYLFFLEQFTISVKWGGATGGHNALQVSYPDVDWKTISCKFVEEFIPNNGFMKFSYNEVTTQIEPHDTYAELFGTLTILNNILLDFSRDIWMYISRGVLKQIKVEGEVGSSAMPQKVNPIMFENAEGNLGIANALFNHFKDKLPISRNQRDLSDSTVERYFGAACASTLIALKSLESGMKKIHLDTDFLEKELYAHWEIVSEAYQTILRREGVSSGYEILKDFVRGENTTKEDMHGFLEKLFNEGTINAFLLEDMKKITPHNYIGNCAD